MVILNDDALRLEDIGSGAGRKYSATPSVIKGRFKAFDANGGTHGRAPCGPIVRDMVWDAAAVSERGRISGSNMPTHPTAREHSSQGRKIKFTKKDQSHAQCKEYRDARVMLGGSYGHHKGGQRQRGNTKLKNKEHGNATLT